MLIDIRSTMKEERRRCHFEPISPIAIPNSDFLNEVLGGGLKPHYLSRNQVYKYEDRLFLNYEVTSASLMVQSAHMAFTGHNGLTIRPDVLWFMIVSQIAEYVKQNVNQFAHLFTTTPGQKKEILVRDDSLVYGSLDNDWRNTIELFRHPLRNAVTDETADLFLTRFSTSSPEDEVALLVAFMDSASPYYEFTVQTLCGIPSINLLGIQSDYAMIIIKCRRLARNFPALKEYFATLEPVLTNIVDSFERPNLDFWASVYHLNQVSGGDTVDGWINAFQLFRQTDQGPVMKTRFKWLSDGHGWGFPFVNSFPSHIVTVPFKWLYYEQTIPMKFIAGPIGVDFTEGHFDARLGFGVYEVK